MNKFVAKYNEDYVITREEAHKIVLKPYEVRTRAISKKETEEKTKYAVRIKNLDFEVGKDEIKRLGADFGEVRKVEMNIRPNGLNSGTAVVYFSRYKHAHDFAYFCQGLKHLERTLSANVIKAVPSKGEEKLKEEA